MVWMACTSHHFVLTHTQAHALWLCPSPHHHSIVCVLAITCHVCLVNHTTQSHALVFSLSSPVCAIHAFPIHRVCACACGGLVVGVCWCGHLCEWLSGGWLCWLHHTVCRVCLHTLTRVCLHSLTGGGWVVDGGPGGGLAGRTVGGVDTCGQGGWHSGTVSLTPLCLSTPCGPSPNSSFLSLLCVCVAEWVCVWTWPLAWVARGLGAQAMVA